MKILKNIRYKGESHRVGDEISIDKSDVQEFISLGVIDEPETKKDDVVKMK